MKTVIAALKNELLIKEQEANVLREALAVLTRGGVPPSDKSRDITYVHPLGGKIKVVKYKKTFRIPQEPPVKKHSRKKKSYAKDINKILSDGKVHTHNEIANFFKDKYPNFDLVKLNRALFNLLYRERLSVMNHAKTGVKSYKLRKMLRSN